MSTQIVVERQELLAVANQLRRVRERTPISEAASGQLSEACANLNKILERAPVSASPCATGHNWNLARHNL